jgi:hypothetical protein
MNSYTSILIIVFFLVVSSCKKYPDGPLISLRSKDARLTARWQMEKYLVNGADSTEKLNPGNSKYNIAFNHGNKPQVFTDINYNGFYEFREDKSIIRIYGFLYPLNYEFGLILNDDCEWKILRLTHKQLWLETSLQGRTYHAELSYLNEK